MKVRSGFVSNSSSSSFVVAFPKKPKSFDDVYELMFNSEEGGIQPYDFIDGMSHSQIAMRVWEDIKKATSKGTSDSKDEWLGYRAIAPAKRAEIEEELACRYYYNTADGCVSTWGCKTDALGGQWSPPVGEYCGEDREALRALRDFTIEVEGREREIRKRQSELISEFLMERPPYATEGGKDKNGKPYTKKAIKKYKDYYKDLEKFRKEHKEYAKLEKELRDGWEIKYSKEEELRNRIAKADTTAFRADNKGAFFAILSYADDGGDCTLEHGNIFKNIPNIRVSHH